LLVCYEAHVDNEEGGIRDIEHFEDANAEQ
jgi:hypothetical protein